MRVLHVSSGNLYGGVETLLTTMARHRQLVPEMVPSFALAWEGRQATELRQAGAPVHMLPAARASRPWTVVAARRALRAVIEAHGFDAVVLHNPWAFAVFAPAASGATRAVAIVLHGAVERLGWIERWSRRSRPDLVLANSRFTASTAGRLFPSLPARLWYYPIEEPPQSPDPIARAAVRAELGARENTTVIVQVSRMEPWKGHALHLDALSRLPRDLDWTCWQVGGAQRAEERAYAAAMQASSVRLGIADRVRWLGARTDVPRLLRAADLHCQPNTGPEPFGITFIEALYARLPVVTTAMGGALDIVDETVGLLVPPAAPDALAQALRSLIEDPRTRHRLGAAGPARARSICDVGTQLEALRDALAETIAATTARTRRRNGS